MINVYIYIYICGGGGVCVQIGIHTMTPENYYNAANFTGNWFILE